MCRVKVLTNFGECGNIFCGCKMQRKNKEEFKMVNTNKLKGKIMEQGMTIGSLALSIGVSPSTLGRKIRNLTDMTLNEVELIRKVLNIPPERVIEFFFVEKRK